MEKQSHTAKAPSSLASCNTTKAKSNKQKAITREECAANVTIENVKIKNSDTDDDTLSSHSTLSIDPDEPLVNDIAHKLFVLANKKEHEQRRQAKLRQQNKKTSTMLIKKKKLTINDTDRLFEEKRLRKSTIKNDLTDLYQKCTDRIRSMLDRHQIDQFVQATQNRLITNPNII